MDDMPDLARVAALIGEPARGRMLTALLEGRALTATELALEGEIAPSTASSHLEKLAGAGLVQMARQGRHRYFTLAGPEVAAAIEGLMVIAPRPARAPASSRAGDLRFARICYDHLAGEQAVQLFDRLRQLKWLRRADEGVALTDAGEAGFEGLGVDMAALRAKRRPLCRLCLDWSERRFHLAGALGAAFFERLLALRMLWREKGSRVVSIAPRGRSFLESLRLGP